MRETTKAQFAIMHTHLIPIKKMERVAENVHSLKSPSANSLRGKLAALREAIHDAHHEDDEVPDQIPTPTSSPAMKVPTSPNVFRSSPWMSPIERRPPAQFSIKNELTVFKSSMDSLRNSTDCILETE